MADQLKNERRFDRFLPGRKPIQELLRNFFLNRMKYEVVFFGELPKKPSLLAIGSHGEHPDHLRFRPRMKVAYLGARDFWFLIPGASYPLSLIADVVPINRKDLRHIRENTMALAPTLLRLLSTGHHLGIYTQGTRNGMPKDEEDWLLQTGPDIFVLNQILFEMYNIEVPIVPVGFSFADPKYNPNKHTPNFDAHGNPQTGIGRFLKRKNRDQIEPIIAQVRFGSPLSISRAKDNKERKQSRQKLAHELFTLTRHR